mmetsp:Transcript_10292/g.15258  ORF Transcript_10292/g.15258 Transcript_10292/m.15258 type:complete len:256 (+) Transcript_10292:142-909(+)
MVKKQMSSEELVYAPENESTSATAGEREHIIVSSGSAEEESDVNTTQHRSKKVKALAVASTLLAVGAVAFAVVVFRPGGLGNSTSIQSSEGKFFESPTYWPTYYPTYFPTLDTDILESASSFQTTTAKADKTETSGDGEGPGIKPIIKPSAPNPAPTQNSADGSGELPPVPAPADGSGSGELPPAPTPPKTTEPLPFIETAFPMETPIPTPMPSFKPTASVTSVATGLGSGEGTVTVSTETTGPPTLPDREPVRK